MTVPLVRPAVAGDHSALAMLMAEMQAHYGVPCPEREAILAGLAGRPDGAEILLACAGDAILGFAAFAALYPGPGLRPGFFLKELYVAAAARGGGAGRALMKAVARAAVARGFARIDWTADRGNARLCGFYEGLGATPQPEKLFFRLSGPSLSSFAASD